jgi:hypothetical protein
MWTAVSTRQQTSNANSKQQPPTATPDHQHVNCSQDSTTDTPTTNSKQLALTSTTDKETKHPTIDKGKNILREISENRLILPILNTIFFSVVKTLMLNPKTPFHFLRNGTTLPVGYYTRL